MSATRPTRWFYAVGAGLSAVGAILLLAFVVHPFGRMFRAMGYRETECTIASAGVRSWRDAGGDEQHAVDVVYHYRVGREVHESTRYDLWDNRKGDARTIAGALPAGARVRCYYDPDRPADAVIDRGLDPLRVIGLLAILPLALGVHLVRWTWRRRHWSGRERRRQVELLGVKPRALALRPLGATLASRLALYGFLGPALLGLCLHDRAGVVGQLARGELSLMPAIWVVILLGAAAAMSALFLHTVMRALGPRFALATVQPARRGAPVVLQWRASGVTPSIRRLTLELVGREEADYDRSIGDRTVSGTDAREIHRRELVRLERTGRRRLSHGSVTVDIPPFAFSFDGGYNRVRWVIELAADVAGWADVGEELEIDIAP